MHLFYVSVSLLNGISIKMTSGYIALIVVLWDEYETNLHFMIVWTTEWKITWKWQKNISTESYLQQTKQNLLCLVLFSSPGQRVTRQRPSSTWTTSSTRSTSPASRAMQRPLRLPSRQPSGDPSWSHVTTHRSCDLTEHQVIRLACILQC